MYSGAVPFVSLFSIIALAHLSSMTPVLVGGISIFLMLFPGFKRHQATFVHNESFSSGINEHQLDLYLHCN